MSGASDSGIFVPFVISIYQNIVITAFLRRETNSLF